MKKIALSTISFLLIVLLGCSDNSNKTTLVLTVVEDLGVPSSGATVEVHSSLQSWLSGGAPLLKGTTNAVGHFESTQALSGDLIVFAEKNTKNNWPSILTLAPIAKDASGVYNGGAAISESLYADIKANSTKNYLLTDVKNSSGVSIFASVAACSKDNFIKLGLDQKMTSSEGANVCAGQSPQTILDYDTQVSKSSQITMDGQLVYGVFLTNQSSSMYIATSFSTIFLVTSGVKSVYTRQN